MQHGIPVALQMHCLLTHLPYVQFGTRSSSPGNIVSNWVGTKHSSALLYPNFVRSSIWRLSSRHETIAYLWNGMLERSDVWLMRLWEEDFPIVHFHHDNTTSCTVLLVDFLTVITKYYYWLFVWFKCWVLSTILLEWKMSFDNKVVL